MDRISDAEAEAALGQHRPNTLYECSRMVGVIIALGRRQASSVDGTERMLRCRASCTLRVRFSDTKEGWAYSATEEDRLDRCER